MINVEKSFNENGKSNGYIVETLSGERILVISSKTEIDIPQSSKRLVVNDDLVEILDKLIKK